MVVVSGIVASATLVLGYDIMSAQPFLDFATAKFPRRLKRVSLTGSTAINDFKVTAKYGPREVAVGLYNVHTGTTLEEPSDPFYIVDTDVLAPDEPLILQVTDAAANDVLVKVEIDSA